MLTLGMKTYLINVPGLDSFWIPLFCLLGSISLVHFVGLEVVLDTSVSSERLILPDRRTCAAEQQDQSSNRSQTSIETY